MCIELIKIDIPKAVYIGDTAFSGCSNLETVILRNVDSVCEFTATSFNDCVKLFSGEGHIYIYEQMWDWYESAYSDALQQLTGMDFFPVLFRKIEDYPEICG
jgi:hypothetical protein